MDKSVIIESLKAFSVGAIIGLIIMYFRNAENFATPIAFGILALSYHAREYSYRKPEQK